MTYKVVRLTAARRKTTRALISRARRCRHYVSVDWAIPYSQTELAGVRGRCSATVNRVTSWAMPEANYSIGAVGRTVGIPPLFWTSLPYERLGNRPDRPL
jgi:hypothetical protein